MSPRSRFLRLFVYHRVATQIRFAKNEFAFSEFCVWHNAVSRLEGCQAAAYVCYKSLSTCQRSQFPSHTYWMLIIKKITNRSNQKLIANSSQLTWINVLPQSVAILLEQASMVLQYGPSHYQPKNRYCSEIYLIVQIKHAIYLIVQIKYAEVVLTKEVWRQLWIDLAF